MLEQSPELEVLDQLLGGDMSLDLLRPLFPTDEHFERAVRMMLHDSEVTLLDCEGRVVPEWKARQVLADPAAWTRGTPYLLSLTERGARRV